MADPADVAAALLARCASLTHGSPVMPVALPDKAFTPPKKANGDARPYFRVDLFRNAPFWEGLASGRVDQGLLQITVVWPKQQGIVKSSAAAAAVAAHFPKGLRLVGQTSVVRVTGEPWAATPVLNDKTTDTPVTIPWRAS
jgi:hypothetical protein